MKFIVPATSSSVLLPPTAVEKLMVGAASLSVIVTVNVVFPEMVPFTPVPLTKVTVNDSFHSSMESSFMVRLIIAVVSPPSASKVIVPVFDPVASFG